MPTNRLVWLKTGTSGGGGAILNMIMKFVLCFWKNSWLVGGNPYSLKNNSAPGSRSVSQLNYCLSGYDNKNFAKFWKIFYWNNAFIYKRRVILRTVPFKQYQELCVACVTPTRCACVLQLNYQLFKSQQSSEKTKQKRFLQRIDHSATVADVADIYGAFVSNALN
jgi:hypothetical protein